MAKTSDHISSADPVAADGASEMKPESGASGRRSNSWRGSAALQGGATQLEVAYRATTYRVFLPGGSCDLRLDEACEALRGWLKTAGCRQFAIITADNPGSQPTAEAINAERQAQLECDLIEGNYEPYAGQNVPDAADWPVEESCFVPDLAPEDACALARDYGQNAVVCGGPDGVPHLVWVEETE